MPVDAVSAVRSQENKAAWVRFSVEAVENKKETLRQGKWVGDDVEMVHITSPYTKDEHDKKVTTWFEQLDLQLMQGRIPREHYDHYKAQYEAWKEGQELPVNGTPIKGWPMISPAQQQILLSCRIRTVEDLAGMNDDGIRQVGMGAVEMKGRALAYLQAASEDGRGLLSAKVTATEARNRELEIEVHTLQDQVKRLLEAVKVQGYTTGLSAPPLPSPIEITAAGLGLDPVRNPVAQVFVPPSNPPPVVKRHRRTKAEIMAVRTQAKET